MIHRVMLAVMLLLGLNAYASDSMQRVTLEFERRLDQSRKTLQRTSSELRKLRQPQLQELQALENQLMTLRQQLAGATRDRDEEFVSIQVLQKRLSEWRQQSRYIDNLLHGYLGSDNELDNASLFSERLRRLSESLQPEWQDAEVTGLDGRMLSGQQLNLGPLSWFIDEQNQGYIADAVANPTTLVMQSPSSLNNMLTIPVDISQDKAIRIASSHGSWFTKLEQGGIWVYPILLLGLLAACVTMYKLLFLSRLTRLQPRFAEDALEGKALVASGWQRSSV